MKENKTLSELGYELDQARKELILALAYKLKIDRFCQWLENKLEKLSDWKITLLAAASVAVLFTALHLLDKLVKP